MPEKLCRTRDVQPFKYGDMERRMLVLCMAGTGESDAKP
jgi:hypothetical protein